MSQADGNSIQNIVELKPPPKDKTATARPRRYRRRKRQLAAVTADAAPTAPSGVTQAMAPAVTQSVTPVSPHLEILHGPAATPTRLGAVLLLVAAAIAALGIFINAQTGWRFGTTLAASTTFAGLSVAADILALMLPSVALALWHRAHRALAAAALATWALALALAALASIGFVNLHIGDAAAARAAVTITAKMATGQRDDAIATAKQAAAAATISRQAECEVRGPRCRALEQEEQARLDAVSAALARPIPAAAEVADADPQLAGALRLATWAGLDVTAADLGNLRLAMMALLPNLAGVVLCFGLALRRSA